MVMYKIGLNHEKTKEIHKKEMYFRNLTLFKLYIICYNTKEYERAKKYLYIFRGYNMGRLSMVAQKQICEIIDRYKDEETPLMLILSDIQKEYGYIPLEVQELVSDKTGIPVAEIYGVVTFYSYFSLEPKGKYVIGVCLGTACYVKGSQMVIDKFSELLKINPGQTTEDGLFTLDALRCIGACGIAPAVTINGKVYSKVSVNEVAGIIESYRQEAAK